jgi:hypothetical protein
MRIARWMAVSATLGLATGMAGFAQAAKGAVQGGSAAEQAVLKAENDRFAAMHNGDVAALEKVLAPELSYTHTSGNVQTKEQFISDIKTGTIKYLTIEPSDMKVRIFGTTAVITGGASVHIILNGNDMSFKIRYTDVHVNRGGAWQMVAWEATRLPA